MTDDDVTMVRYRHEHLTRFQATHRDGDYTYSGTSYQDRVRELALVSADDVPALLAEVERLRVALAALERDTQQEKDA